MLAAQLLGAADVWLFVTTAARYADAVPWELLADAARRGTHLALVLDRVDPGAETAVGDHLRQMLADAGLAAATVHRRPRGRAGGRAAARGRRRADRRRPHRTATDPAVARRGARRDLGRGGRRTCPGAALDLATAADEQRAADARLRAAVAAAYATAADAGRARDVGRVAAARRGAGPVAGRGRHQRVVPLARAGGVPAARPRGRVRARAPPGGAGARRGGGARVVGGHPGRGRGRRRDRPLRLAARPGGPRAARRAGPVAGVGDLRARTAEQVRAWQGDVLSLVETEGADRRTTARALSYGVNGLGAVLMVAVFASTGGLTGAEVGIVGGSALLAQRLLEAVFGDDAVRRLTQEAHEPAGRAHGRAAGGGGRPGSRASSTRRAPRGRDGDDLRRVGGARAVGDGGARPRATAWGAGELPAGGGGHLRGTGAVAPVGGRCADGRASRSAPVVEPLVAGDRVSASAAGTPARARRGARRGGRSRARAAARRRARGARRRRGARAGPARAVRGVHGGRARRRDRLGQVVAAQRPRGRARSRRPGVAPSDDGQPGRGDRPRRAAPARHGPEHGADEPRSTGSTCRERHVAAQPRSLRSPRPGWCCWTCPTTTRW